jgi:uncharacterized protein with PQ loop repeat
MNILPVRHSTLVVSYPAEVVLQKLRKSVRSADESLFKGADATDVHYFVGIVSGNKFIISRKFSQYQNFLPRVKGHVEATSIGSIIFVRFTIFYSAAVMLFLSSAIALLVAFIFLYFQGNLPVFLFSVGVFILNYVVTILNFNKQVEVSRKELERVLNT